MKLSHLVSIVLTVLLLISFSAVRGSAAVTRLYVVNNLDNTVSVIDTTTNTVITTIKVGASPTGIAYNPANKKVYVVNRGDNTVSIIDTVNHLVTGTILSVGPYPWYVAVDPTTHNIDLNQWVKGLPVNFVYVTSPVSNNVDIIISTFDGLLNLPGGNIHTDVPPGIGVFNIALDIASQKAYAVNCHNATLSILDLQTKKMAATVENLENTDSFVGVGLDTGLNKVYAVGDKIDVMPVIDVNAKKVVAKIKVGTSPYNVTVDSTAHKAYVVNRGSNSISVVNTSKDTVESTIKVGTEPISLVLADGKAYVTNCGSNNISVIDTAANKVTSTIPLTGMKSYRGFCPWGIAAF
ncbi:MAG: YncE family protein [Nitrospirae bacterium]|nr:YncE family protein [Nitrospirota bacterium]